MIHMDSLTHILVGATIGLALRHQPMRRKLAMFTGALACTVPDFDVFIFSRSNPLIQEIVHRSFSHSLLLIPLGALLVTAFILLFFQSTRPYWKQIALIALFSYASHAPLDACTSYGTQLFWPFSHERVSFDIISIIDPVFTGILLFGCIWAYRRKSNTIALRTLVIAGLYLCFCTFQHERAIKTLKSLSPPTAVALRAFPELGSQYTWQGLYRNNNLVYIATIHTPLFANASVQLLGTVPLFQNQALPANIIINPELSNAISTFQWFSQGYVGIAGTAPFTLVDLRYLGKRNTLQAYWGIALVQAQNHWQIKKVLKVPLQLSISSTE